MLLELIFSRDGSLYVDLPCFAHDMFLFHICLPCDFKNTFYLSLLLYFLVRFHNKYI